MDGGVTCRSLGHSFVRRWRDSRVAEAPGKKDDKALTDMLVNFTTSPGQLG